MSEPRLGRRNLPLEIHASKNESMMRSKIRLLEEQVTRLQSGMNLFANLEEKSRELPTNQTKSCGHEQQLRSMSAKLVTLEQDRQRLTRKVNTLESELHDSQEREKSATERISDLQEDNKQLSIQLNQNSLRIRELELQQRYLQQQKLRVEEQLKRLHEKHNTYVHQVELIDHHILIRISHKDKLTLLKLSDYEALKNELFTLKLKLSELEGRERWQKENEQFKRRKTKFELTRECPDIGQEIVRLKRNIDTGLGSPESEVAGNFLTKFNEVKKALDSLGS